MKVNRVHIKNFKSVVDLSLDLAPINVFIGENGSGKSNILEALAFAAAAAANKLDNEFLVSRGIRVTDPRFMRSAFAEASEDAIVIDMEGERGIAVTLEINAPGDAPYPKWQVQPLKVSTPSDVLTLPSKDELARVFADAGLVQRKSEVAALDKLVTDFYKLAEMPASPLTEEIKSGFLAAIAVLFTSIQRQYQIISLADFMIYSPEICALRTFEKEGQILPLGVRGEGLLKLLRVLASEDKEAWHALQNNLGLLDWLSGIDIDHDDRLPGSDEPQAAKIERDLRPVQ